VKNGAAKQPNMITSDGGALLRFLFGFESPSRRTIPKEVPEFKVL